MQLRVFCPGPRTNVTAWVKGCACCLSYNVCRNRKQELNFSWPVTIPFYIMHIDLWDPGKALSKNAAGRHLLKAIYDLMQFVISTITTETHAEYLVKILMENVVLLFVMFAILVVSSYS